MYDRQSIIVDYLYTGSLYEEYLGYRVDCCSTWLLRHGVYPLKAVLGVRYHWLITCGSPTDHLRITYGSPADQNILGSGACSARKMDMTGSNGASNGHNLPLLRTGQDQARPGKTRQDRVLGRITLKSKNKDRGPYYL